MADIVDVFRAKLSEELRAAMAKRDKEDTSTIRSLMSAIDNAGALSKDEIAKLSSEQTEVPRKKLSTTEIHAILNAEIEIRKSAHSDYTKIGNKAQAELIEHSIATIHRLGAMLPK